MLSDYAALATPFIELEYIALRTIRLEVEHGNLIVGVRRSHLLRWSVHLLLFHSFHWHVTLALTSLHLLPADILLIIKEHVVLLLRSLLHLVTTAHSLLLLLLHLVLPLIVVKARVSVILLSTSIAAHIILHQIVRRSEVHHGLVHVLC